MKKRYLEKWRQIPENLCERMGGRLPLSNSTQGDE